MFLAIFCYFLLGTLEFVIPLVFCFGLFGNGNVSAFSMETNGNFFYVAIMSSLTWYITAATEWTNILLFQHSFPYHSFPCLICSILVCYFLQLGGS